MTSAANCVAPRRGFTLIELLVVMALIAGLAAMAMVVAPSAINKDRTAAAVSQIQGALQIARARAIRDGLGNPAKPQSYGVRFLWDPSKPNPSLVTEYQYIETTPMVVPNPGGPIGVAPYPANAPPYVEFTYNPTSGPVTGRTCTIRELNTTDQGQVAGGGMLYLPTLGTWHHYSATITNPAYPGSVVTLTLDTYPDQQLGAETRWRTYHFGLNGGARTLLGEPTISLPQNTCVDLSGSEPAILGKDYDILFTSSGLLASGSTPAGAGQVFLRVRDPNKPANFQQGGEQLVVSIKAKTGGIGAAPVDWGGDPFILAKRSLSGQ